MKKSEETRGCILVELDKPRSMYLDIDGMIELEQALSMVGLNGNAFALSTKGAYSVREEGVIVLTGINSAKRYKNETNFIEMSDVKQILTETFRKWHTECKTAAEVAKKHEALWSKLNEVISSGLGFPTPEKESPPKGNRSPTKESTEEATGSDLNPGKLEG